MSTGETEGVEVTLEAARQRPLGHSLDDRGLDGSATPSDHRPGPGGGTEHDVSSREYATVTHPIKSVALEFNGLSPTGCWSWFLGAEGKGPRRPRQRGEPVPES